MPERKSLKCLKNCAKFHTEKKTLINDSYDAIKKFP